MGLVTWRVSYYKYNGTDVDLGNGAGPGYDDPIDLEDAKDIKLTLSVGDGKDSFSFMLSNVNGDYNAYFNPNDKYIIYRKVDDFSASPVWDEEDVLLSGASRDVPLTKSYNRDDVKIAGYNYSETLMNALTFVDATEMPINEALQESLEKVTLFNNRFKVTWKDTNPTVTYDGGTAFPLCDEKFFNKSINYILKKYSANTKTTDGNYYYFVNSANELVWDKRQDNVSDTFNSETDSYYEMVIKKDTKDVKNFVVIKGGTDPKGRIIQNYHPDYGSIANHGFRYYIMIDEAKTCSSTVDNDCFLNGVDYMSDASYPLTPPWNSGVAVTSYDDYVYALRIYIKAELKAIGKIYVDKYKYGRLTVTIKKKPDSVSWGLGDVISCTIPELQSEADKSMRVEVIDYGTDSDMYTLKEDVGMI